MVIRRSWKVSITWRARFAHYAYQPEQRFKKILELMSGVGKNIRYKSGNSHIVGVDKVMILPLNFLDVDSSLVL